MITNSERLHKYRQGKRDRGECCKCKLPAIPGMRTCVAHKRQKPPVVDGFRFSALRHGRSKTPTYYSWEGMRERCLNPKNKRWADYGGRGISVCGRWDSFEAFLADMGERPKGKTLDRYPDKNGNYEPGNCRWATPKEQQNNMRSNRILEFNGKLLTVSQ